MTLKLQNNVFTGLILGLVTSGLLWVILSQTKANSSWNYFLCSNAGVGASRDVYLTGVNELYTSRAGISLELDDDSVYGCTEEEIGRQVRSVAGKLETAALGCAEPVDLERFLSSIWRHETDLTFINVGANKGYNLVKWMAYWTPHLNVSLAGWGSHLSDSFPDTDFSCGVCGDCREEVARPWLKPASRSNLSEVERKQQPTIIAMEPSISTFQLLEELKNWSKYPGLHLHNFAASNETGEAMFPRTRPGSEVYSLAGGHGIEMLPIRMVTVDDFFLEQRIKKVHILKIDTEGFDPLVLLGAAKTLEAGVVSILEFEYHEIGHWTKIHLVTVVDMLDKYGYECFLKLWTEAKAYARLTSCMSPELEFKKWSNVVCSRRKDIWSTLFMLGHCTFL